MLPHMTGGKSMWQCQPFRRLSVISFFPGLLDKMMANNGFDGQQTDEPEDPNRKHNLWEPVPGNHSAHGRFDDISKNSSPVLWLSLHPGVFWGTLIIVLILIVILLALFI